MTSFRFFPEMKKLFSSQTNMKQRHHKRQSLSSLCFDLKAISASLAVMSIAHIFYASNDHKAFITFDVWVRKETKSGF